jgi:hypothetical protein
MADNGCRQGWASAQVQQHFTFLGNLYESDGVAAITHCYTCTIHPKCEFQYLTEHKQNNKFPAGQGVNRYSYSHLEAPGVDRTIMMKWMVTEWHAFIWLRIRTSGGLLRK